MGDASGEDAKCRGCGKAIAAGEEWCDACWETDPAAASLHETAAMPPSLDPVKGLEPFEGEQPTAQTLVFTNGHAVTAENHVTHHLSSVVYAVVQCEIGGVNHKRDANGELRRVETLQVKGYGILPVAEGSTLLERYRPKVSEQLAIGDAYDDDDPAE